jgi:hypothetical protein
MCLNKWENIPKVCTCPKNAKAEPNKELISFADPA